MVKAAPSRIVALSSHGHHISPLVFEDINFEQREYNKWASYGQSKTANILHAVELERRLGSHGVHAYAVHPGVIQTELSRHLDETDWEMLRGRMDSGEFKLKTIPAGAATSVYAATAPELEGRGGVYLFDCQVEQPGLMTKGRMDRPDKQTFWGKAVAMIGAALRGALVGMIIGALMGTTLGAMSAALAEVVTGTLAVALGAAFAAGLIGACLGGLAGALAWLER